MARCILGLVAVMAGVAGPAAAQQTTPPAPAHNTFVLMGCLEAGANTAERFTLTRAEAVGQAPPVRAAAPDTPAGAPLSAVGTSGRRDTYELRPVTAVSQTGASEETLKAHVGQRVRVTVRPVETAAPPASTSVTTPKTAEPPAPPVPERYTVTEIARATGSCS